MHGQPLDGRDVRAVRLDQLPEGQHMRKPDDEEPGCMDNPEVWLQCKLCPHKTWGHDLLRQHTKLHEMPKDDVFTCNMCFYMCKTARNLKRHMGEMHNMRLYKVNSIWYFPLFCIIFSWR